VPRRPVELDDVAQQQLERELGLSVRASFEHEFQLEDEGPAALPFSLEGQRLAEAFTTRAMACLAEAGVEPERVFCEYAPRQFEIPVAAAAGMASADRAVFFREVVREAARRSGTRATFVPLLDPEQAGNGVHVHIDLHGADGSSALYDPSRPGALSEVGGSFAAGILRQASALSALTAPSPVSAGRLRPHRWSAGAVCLGLQNRETLLRLPGLATLGGAEPGRQMRLEYRGADASANPYLALAALLKAGLEGVRGSLPSPPLLEVDPSALSDDDAARFGVGALPERLEDALAALSDDEVLRPWLPPLLYDAYVGVKRSEIEATAQLDVAATCTRYAAIY
jgi:glutamine synthetase